MSPLKIMISLKDMKIPSLNRYGIVLCLLLPFALTYIFNLLSSLLARYGNKRGGKPPIVPYWFPWVGHAIPFFWNRAKLASWVRGASTGSSSSRLVFFNIEANVVYGFDQLSAVWKSKILDTKPAACLALQRFFGTPSAALKFWVADNTGTNVHPHPNSNVKPDHRIYFHTNRSTHEFMAGKGLKSFANRFQDLLIKRVSEKHIGNDWIQMPDLYSFIQIELSTAAVEALCGPALLKLSPTWIQDFWEFDKSIPRFLSGFPWLFARSAYKARCRCLEGIKSWHKYVQENFEESCIEPDGHDPFFGSSLMRSRQKIWAKMEPMDADARASEDLGLLWGENSNSIPGAFWSVVHIIQDPSLLYRVRKEVQTCLATPDSSTIDFNIDALCRNPLLQSIWYETLRLYVALFIVRGSDHDDFYLDQGYTIGRGHMIVVDTYAAHHNAAVWNTGNEQNPHPLNQFWAERFLVYPDDPNSGPLKRKSTLGLVEPAFDKVGDCESKGPKFSSSGLSGAWVPFGGGRHQCPGRNFAKQEIILCIAVICLLFDMELSPGAKLEPNKEYYGLGTLPQKGKVPFQIRERMASISSRA